MEHAVDGGFVILGFNRSVQPNAAYLIKIDALGNLVWESSFQNRQLDSLERLDDGYVLAGWDFTTGNGVGTLIAADRDGKFLWEKRSAGPRASPAGYRRIETFRAVHRTPDGGFVAAGNSSNLSDVEDYRAYVVRTDADGNFLWEGYLPPGREVVFAVRSTSDGGYIIGGRSPLREPRDYYDDVDVFLTKLSPRVDSMGFIRGEVTGDRRVGFADGMAILNTLFLGARGPLCQDTADVDDSGAVTIK